MYYPVEAPKHKQHMLKQCYADHLTVRLRPTAEPSHFISESTQKFESSLFLRLWSIVQNLISEIADVI